jgi:DNA modification methylase
MAFRRQETFLPRSHVPAYLLAFEASAGALAINTSDAVSIIRGDALQLIPALPRRSVQCAVTSSPYWGMRVYDNQRDITWADGESCPYGFEQTPEGFIRHTVELLRLLKPAMTATGSVWWNYESAEKITDVWCLPTANGKNGHGTEFPLALPGRCITLSTGPGDLVLDPFVGSGTTALAALHVGRRCVGFEISEEYVTRAHERVAAARAGSDGGPCGMSTCVRSRRPRMGHRVNGALGPTRAHARSWNRTPLTRRIRSEPKRRLGFARRVDLRPDGVC